jgi:hypothetical protein
MMVSGNPRSGVPETTDKNQLVVLNLMALHRYICVDKFLLGLS